MLKKRTISGALGLVGALLAAGCSSSVLSAGETGVDVPVVGDASRDAPAPPDVPARNDVPAPPDVPAGADVPVPPDAPVTCSFAGATGVAISLSGPGGAPMDCAGMRPTPPGGAGMVVSRTAAVVEVRDDATGSRVTLDYCSPAADCVPLIGTLAVSAPGFTLGGGAPNALRPGQYVRVRARATWSWGCTMQVEVANAPAWDGVANPVRSDSALLAAAASGEPQALPEADFGVARRSIGCTMSGTNCGGGVPELFALEVQGSCRACLRAPDPVLVRQGASGQFQIDALTYELRNHRSFNTGACDDYWNYAWTAREVWLE